MANALYGKGKEKLLTAAINISSDTIKAALVSSAYTPDLAAHEFYTSISGSVLNTPQTLASKTITLGVVDAADILYTAVTSGATAKAVVIYKDTGTGSTSALLAYIDTITGFPLATNGGDVTITWDNGANKIFAL
jgi:hypothetical protein